MANIVAPNCQLTIIVLADWLEIELIGRLLRKGWTMLAFKEGLLARRITIMLIILMSLISVVPRVEAAFIPSGESQTDLMRDQDMQIIKQALENKVITQRLQDLGFSDQEIQDRMDQLSDQEVHSLATQIDSVSQGGYLGVIIAVLVVVLLVVVILKLADL
jgi:hypothetical protein